MASSERLDDVCEKLKSLIVTQTEFQSKILVLSAATIFELFRSSTHFSPVFGLDQEQIRSSSRLWTHRELFGEVNRRFDAAKEDSSLPTGLHTFGELYRAVVHKTARYEQAIACNHACTTVAIRQVLLFLGRFTPATEEHVDPALLQTLLALPPQVYTDVAKLGLHLEFYCSNLKRPLAQMWEQEYNDLDAGGRPSVGVLISAIDTIPFGGLDSTRDVSAGGIPANSIKSHYGKNGSFMIRDCMTVTAHMNLRACKRYQDLLAYDYYTALVALAQSTAPAFTSPGHVVSPAPAILPPRAWLLAEKSACGFQKLAYSDQSRCDAIAPLVVLCPGQSHDSLEAIVISMTRPEGVTSTCIIATILGSYTSCKTCPDVLLQQIKNVVRTYTKWDPKDDFEFFGLQTTTYQVQHVKDLPSTALMIAALFDHLESLGCTQDKTVFADSDKVVDMVTTWLTKGPQPQTTIDPPLPIIIQNDSPVALTMPITMPIANASELVELPPGGASVQSATLPWLPIIQNDSQVALTMPIAIKLSSPRTEDGLEIASSSQSGTSPSASPPLVASAKATSLMDVALEADVEMPRRSKRGGDMSRQVYCNAERPRAKKRKDQSQVSPTRDDPSAARGAIPTKALLNMKAKLLDPLYADRERGDLVAQGLSDAAVKKMLQDGEFSQLCGTWDRGMGQMQGNMYDLKDMFNASLSYDKHKTLAAFFEPIIKTAIRAYGSTMDGSDHIYIHKIERVGTSTAPTPPSGHTSAIEAIHSDFNSSDDDFKIVIVYLRPSRGALPLDDEHERAQDQVLSCMPVAVRRKEHERLVRWQDAGTFMGLNGNDLYACVNGEEDQATLHDICNSIERQNVARGDGQYKHSSDPSKINSHCDMLFIVVSKTPAFKKAQDRTLSRGRICFAADGKPVGKFETRPTSTVNPERDLKHDPILSLRGKLPGDAIPSDQEKEARHLLTSFAVQFVAEEGAASFGHYLNQLQRQLGIDEEQRKQDLLLRCLSAALPARDLSDRTREQQFGDEFTARLLRAALRLVTRDPQLNEKLEKSLRNE